jgi:gliding motility-associated-like protein
LTFENYRKNKNKNRSITISGHIGLKKILLHTIILLLSGISPVFSQMGDTTICGGEVGSLVYQSNNQPSGVVDWQIDGGDILENFGDSIVVQWHSDVDTGRIAATEISIAGCESVPATVSIDLSNPVIELFNQEACQGEEIEFIAENPEGGDYDQYEWHDGSTGSSFTPDTDTAKTENIWVKATDEYGCTTVDSANLTVYELPQIDIEPINYPDQVFYDDDNDSIAFAGAEVREITLDAVGNWGAYEWSTGEITSSINIQAEKVSDPTTPNNTGYYWVEVTDEHLCTNSDTMAVTVIRQLDIPNAITPNNDGDNDKWKIPGLILYPNNVVKIYDRWGDLVYQARGYDESKYWDGTDMNGKELPMDSYYYMIKLGTGEKPIFGSVTIIR